jgi:hypothetical protein
MEIRRTENSSIFDPRQGVYISLHSWSIALSLKTEHIATLTYTLPSTVAARSKAWTVFARSDAEIVGSNPTQGMNVCVYSVFVLGSGLATADHSSESYRMS